MEGQVRTFQDDLLIQEEVSYKIKGNKIYVRYGPIKEIKRAVLYSRGKSIDLEIKSIHEDYFTVTDIMPYYNQIEIDYVVDLVETEQIEFSGKNQFEIFPEIGDKYIIGVNELYKINIEDEKEVPEEIKYRSFNLKGITLESRASFGKYRAVIKTLNPVKIAYKTFTVEKRKGLDPSQIELASGEMMAVMGSGYKMGEGDIITLTKSTARHSQYIAFKTGDYDRVPYSPIADIDSIFSKGKNGIVFHKKYEDFIVFGDSQIQWLSDKPRTGYTVIYDYHPTFVVSEFIEGGSGENRKKPMQFKLKVAPSFNGRQGEIK
ncbi:MAG: hypothetical protein OEY34_01570 [Cyclobacteriaceae bacterium]|nr:hypothetical protein [Cyclobacteriaceae bacterium]